MHFSSLLALLVLGLVPLTASANNATGAWTSESSVSVTIPRSTTASCSQRRGFQTLQLLYSIRGNSIVSGQHNDQKDGTDESHYTERVREITGQYPGLYGADFLFHGSAERRWAITMEAERQWAKGAIISLMWHACPPTMGPNATMRCFWEGDILSELTDLEWNDLISDGGDLNSNWKTRIDEISVYLQYLEQRNVEVLWRPLHEQNQPLFWWGGRTGDNGTKKLWQLTHDYMTNELGLKNLIWVWDVQDLQTIDFDEYNPGQEYFDIAALDIYAPAFSYTFNLWYISLLANAGDRVVAIGENFQLPTQSVLDSQPMWTFFMTWANGLEADQGGSQTNSIGFIREVYNNPRVLKLKDMPGWLNQSFVFDCQETTDCSDDLDCGFDGYCLSDVCYYDFRSYHSTLPGRIFAVSDLDRHTMDCGGNGISQFQLVSPLVFNYNYYYTCSQLNNMTTGAMRQTSMDIATLGNVIFLDRHAIGCQGKAIQYLRLVSDGGNIGYAYQCGYDDLFEVTDYYTEWDSIGFLGTGQPGYLDRHKVSCPTGKVLSFVQLQTNDSMRYHYRCGFALYVPSP
ncbi:Mannan endo-1,4-beta-mannosidase [Seminavis robusta]|uniref:Mannan endo-1,4-beta-mannosidase n=1 Tax=Seminavis robusta TaxID=568900 RepID=A0A9N8DP44_9STRA|nr:Mannan endo-1,4-beta-mannosidase [Seminavis robusta]|eukprot:Sro188_g081140.1 Mannan endo-1,4-beta-mannosidase (570) ;mRNA; r:25869-27578